MSSTTRGARTNVSNHPRPPSSSRTIAASHAVGPPPVSGAGGGPCRHHRPAVTRQVVYEYRYHEDRPTAGNASSAGLAWWNSSTPKRSTPITRRASFRRDVRSGASSAFAPPTLTRTWFHPVCSTTEGLVGRTSAPAGRVAWRFAILPTRLRVNLPATTSRPSRPVTHRGSVMHRALRARSRTELYALMIRPRGQAVHRHRVLFDVRDVTPATADPRERRIFSPLRMRREC